MAKIYKLILTCSTYYTNIFCMITIVYSPRGMFTVLYHRFITMADDIV
jgi:hypothetical protein